MEVHDAAPWRIGLLLSAVPRFCNSAFLTLYLGTVSEPCIVLIASPDLLPKLTPRVSNPDGEVLAFTDADALRALEVITKRRPALVALERVFAATPRGAALINRIKADPSLTICTGNLSTQLANAYFPDHTVITERVNDIANCDARITAGTADIYMNSMPSLSVATSAGLVLQNSYTSVDTHIAAGTPIWVAKEGITCTGSYNDFVPDLCTETGN